MDWQAASAACRTELAASGSCSLNDDFFASQEQEGLMAKYGLLWLLGVPLPIILVLYFVFH